MSQHSSPRPPSWPEYLFGTWLRLMRHFFSPNALAHWNMWCDSTEKQFVEQNNMQGLFVMWHPKCSIHTCNASLKAAGIRWWRHMCEAAFGLPLVQFNSDCFSMPNKCRLAIPPPCFLSASSHSPFFWFLEMESLRLFRRSEVKMQVWAYSPHPVPGSYTHFPLIFVVNFPVQRFQGIPQRAVILPIHAKVLQAVYSQVS